MTAAELQKEFLSSGDKRIAPEDFFILLAHATEQEKVFLFAHPEYILTPKKESRAREYFARRKRHEPVALIIGQKEFYGRSFTVTSDTLIPRPETELLVELALSAITERQESAESQPNKMLDCIDIGTGSGCIGISIALTLSEKYPDLFSQTKFFATDISRPALVVAGTNANAYQLSPHITFLEGDLLAPYLAQAKNTEEGNNILITANLPYLSRAIYDNAPEDVRDFEPESALVSEQAGLDHYYRLLQSIPLLFAQNKSIILFLEISPEQGEGVKEHIAALFPSALISVHRDLADKERVIKIRLSPV